MRTLVSTVVVVSMVADLRGDDALPDAAAGPLRHRGGPVVAVFQLAGLPGPLPGEPLVQADLRLPAEARADAGGVGQGVPLVAGPRRLLADLDLAAGQPFQLAQHVPDAHRLGAADVVH